MRWLVGQLRGVERRVRMLPVERGQLAYLVALARVVQELDYFATGPKLLGVRLAGLLELAR